MSLSLSPQISLSLCLSLPPSCLIPHHDLPVFVSYKNLMIRCLIIIDCNKLSEDTMLFHLGDFLQYETQLQILNSNAWNKPLIKINSERRAIKEGFIKTPFNIHYCEPSHYFWGICKNTSVTSLACTINMCQLQMITLTSSLMQEVINTNPEIVLW
jgi:hypothetical protein